MTSMASISTTKKTENGHANKDSDNDNEAGKEHGHADYTDNEGAMTISKIRETLYKGNEKTIKRKEKEAGFTADRKC